ncbi:MAG: apolipoprotein N-acyltransferase [Chitinophagaceae bacterium]|nr:apolipoprotein N-acyltransferase [Chitinophagaceae bacterium]
MRTRSLLLSITSGALAWLGWPGSPLGQSILLFIAWVPLLLLSTLEKSTRRFFLLCYLSMLIWNLGTTWWIWNATAPGAVAAWLANSLLMCIPWLGYHFFSKKVKPLLASLGLICFWMSFEYLHLQDWGLSWPWLTIGNGLATHPEWIQWYTFTGVAGGTLWILLVNILLYHHWLSNQQIIGRKKYHWLILAFFIALSPILISSYWSTRKIEIQEAQKEIIIVQPNIDPYEKITAGTEQKQLAIAIGLSKENLNEKTALLIWPETALYSPYGFDEEKLNDKEQLTPLRSLLSNYPGTSLFTGIESYRWVNEATPYSRKTTDGLSQFEAYNAGVLIDHFGTHGFYHKSKLVPGVETLPWFLRFMDSWFEKFGGVTAGYAKQNDRNILEEKNGIKLAPAICYESIYGDFLRQYVKKGANLITIITNDGWWKKTPGHIQHFHYAKLRAIETGCWVARSANTGISGFINPKGAVIEAKGYGVAASLRQSISLTNNAPTFYVQHGDWLFQLMLVLTIIGVPISLLPKFRQ